MKKNSAHAYNGALYIENVKNVIHFFVHFSYSCTATSVGIRFSALLGVWEIAGEWEKYRMVDCLWPNIGHPNTIFGYQFYFKLTFFEIFFPFKTFFSKCQTVSKLKDQMLKKHIVSIFMGPNTHLLIFFQTIISKFLTFPFKLAKKKFFMLRSPISIIQ